MNRLLILLLMLAVTHLNTEMRAAEPQDIESEAKERIIKILVSETPTKILLRDSLTEELSGSPLYGDNVAGIQYGGESFDSKWVQGKRLSFKRNSNNEIQLIIPSGLEIGYKESLSAIKAINRGSATHPNWCAGENIVFSVEIIPDVNDSDKQIPVEGNPSGIDSTDSSTENDTYHFSKNIPLLALVLSIINLLLLVYLLLNKKTQKGETNTTKQESYKKDINRITQDIQGLRNLLATQSLKEEDVIRIINSRFTKTPVVTSIPQPIKPTPKPATKHVQTIETIDTLEYSFQENKFILTEGVQQIFVIYKKGNDYTFTLKDAGICQEIMPMLNAYSKCISVMGNTSAANGIGSITPGVLYPTGDGRTFSVASPMIINFI